MNKTERRVGIGVGAFNYPAKAAYSDETRNLIKVLMEESKLTMMQRKNIQDVINKGESLPPSTPITRREMPQIGAQVQYSSVWKKRTKEMIENSGAYQREQYRRLAPLPQNIEKQKRHLACMMAYGKEMPPTPREPQLLHRPRRQRKLREDEDPFDSIVQGIRERIEFLHDMECLGLGKKYKPIIHQEIAQKIRLIESFDKDKSSELRDEIEKFKIERPPPKPFPLGELDDR